MTKIKNDKFSKESGEIAIKQILVLGAIGAAGAIVIILSSGVLKSPPPPPPIIKEPELVYEVSLENAIRFQLQEVKDRGNTLKLEECVAPQFLRQDIITTERFIEVKVLVDNIGKDNINPGYWDIKEIYDSEGSKFYSQPAFNFWVSADSGCSTILKPKFTPTLCSKIYEVAKVSSGLKLEVYFKDSKGQTFIDLGI